MLQTRIVWVYGLILTGAPKDFSPSNQVRGQYLKSGYLSKNIIRYYKLFKAAAVQRHCITITIIIIIIIIKDLWIARTFLLQKGRFMAPGSGTALDMAVTVVRSKFSLCIY